MELTKNFKMLNERKSWELQYDFAKLDDFRKENLAPTKDNLQKNEKEEKITDAIQKSSDLKNLFTEYEENEELFDLLTSIWIVFDQNDEELIEKYNLNRFQNRDLFMKRMRDRIRYARTVALEKRTSRPDPKEVIAARTEKKSPLERREREKKREEKSPDEEPSDEEKPVEKSPDEKSPDKEKPSTEEKPAEKSVVDAQDFPSPKKQSDNLANFKDSKLQEIENVFSNIKEPTKEQEAKYNKTKSKIEKIFSEQTEKIEKQQIGYSVSPTRSSAMKASTNAKKLFNDANRKISDEVSNFKISFMPGRLQRGAMRVGDAGRAVGKVAKKAAGSRAATLSREAMKSAVEKGKEVAKSGAEKAGEAARAGVAKTKEAVRAGAAAKQNIAANTIEKVLGKEKRDEFVNLLRAGKTEEAAKINQEAKNKIDKERGEAARNISRRLYTLKTTSSQNPTFMRTQTQQENFILRNYGKKINELADNPATREETKKEEEGEGEGESKEVLKIAKSPLGRTAAEQYRNLMKGPASDKRIAVGILNRAEIHQKKIENQLGIK
jgi:hypothetical protein